jgi:hypothetical protein
MARYFEITANSATVKLDSQGRGTVQYTVKNVSAAPIDGRAVLISLPPTNPPTGAVQNGWVKIEPPTDRAFDKDKATQTFVVKVEVPPKDRSKAGTYTFRLDAVTVAIPDRGDEGPAVSFTLAPTPEKKSMSVFAWLIPLIVVLLIVIGLGAWLALRNTGPKVPDLAGMSQKDATAALTTAKLTLASPVETIQSKPEDAGKVISQIPAAGAKAKEGDAVHLQMGAPVTPTKAEPPPPVSTPPPPVSNKDCSYGPDTCVSGYVWRDASSSDHVCVTPDVRQQTSSDNALAPRRRNPSGGPYGPDTCLVGFVWRDAFSGDHVCVLGTTRSQAAADNAAAKSRRACQ